MLDYSYNVEGSTWNQGTCVFTGKTQHDGSDDRFDRLLELRNVENDDIAWFGNYCRYNVELDDTGATMYRDPKDGGIEYTVRIEADLVKVEYSEDYEDDVIEEYKRGGTCVSYKYIYDEDLKEWTEKPVGESTFTDDANLDKIVDKAMAKAKHK